MRRGHNPTIVTSAIRELFEYGWQKYRVIYFGAPCGFGKTAVARAMLTGHSVCERSAMRAEGLTAPIPAGCDVVMIDDVHMMWNSEDQLAVCSWINEKPSRTVVLLGRGDLPGWLMPYQFTGLLLKIESEQLLFDRAATAELLEQNGIKTSPEELNAIQEDSRGYPLAVSILSRKMTGGKPYSSSISERTRQEIYFYFETAVYRRFAPPMRRLLAGLSPFETFDAELAKMVSGDSHVNELLSQLLHETSMLLYDNIETYRFWPVFREFLLWELKQDCTAEQQNDISRRAGLYYELHDDYSRALDCYTRSGDHRKISELLVKNAQLHPGAAHYYDMERYYFALPREDVMRSPALLCGMSMLTALCLDYEASEQWYKELQNYGARLKKSDAEYNEVKSKLTYLDIALPQRGSRGLIELIGTVFRALTDKNLKLPPFSVTSCLPSIMNGGKDFCQWSKTDDLLYKTMRLPVETVLGKDGVGLADCALCESKFEKGEDVSARVLGLMSRVSEIERKGTPDIVFAVIGLLARTQTMQGKAHTALEALDGLHARFLETGQTRFLENLDAMRCRLWLRLGDRDKAGRWLRECAPPSALPFRALWRYRYMTKSMALIASDAPDEALLCIAPLLPYSVRCGRTMDVLYLRLLSAICHYRQKDEAWRAELNEALDTAHTYQFITPLAQFGAAILPLLTAAAWEKDPRYFDRVVLAAREQTIYYPDFLRPPVALAVPLTPAETHVLRLLCHNRSNQEIADVLGVQLSTVKSQVRSIMQKLNVSRRSEARDAALGLHLV